MKVSVFTAVASCILLTSALAGPADASIRKTTNIPAESLSDALRTLAKDRQFEILYRAEVVRDVRTEGAVGEFTPEEALKAVLSGTGLSYKYLNANTVTVFPQSSSQGSSSAQSNPTSDDSSKSSAGGGKKSSQDFRVAQVDQGATRSSTVTTTSESFTNNPNGGPALSEIIVTAEKRSEKLEDVPVAVTVLDAATMEQQHLLTLQDYYATVPGLSVSDSGTGRVNITIRGLSTGGLNPTVGITVDDVPIGPTNTATINYAQFVPQLDPADLQQIEFLKGPQGTLYGASSLAGVMRYVTAVPDLSTTSGRIEVEGDDIPGGGSGYGVRGGVNVPIIPDILAMRVSAFDRRDPGYVDDPSHGSTNVNSIDVYGAHGTLLLQATSDFSVRVSALIQRLEGNADSTVDTTSNYVPISQYYNHSRIPDTGNYIDEIQLYSANVTFHTDWFDVTSISAYGINQNDETVDAPSYAPYGDSDGAVFFNTFHTDKLSQEVRLTSMAGSTFEWQVGGFYTNEDNGNVNQLAVSANTATGALGSQIVNYFFPSHYEEYAGFASVKYHFTNQFSVQVGAREGHNIQHYHEVDSGSFYPTGDNIIDERSRDSSFTYLVTPSYRISESVMAYARVASGYQAGGPNASNYLNPAPPTFGPTRTVNYELGIKSRFLDRRFSIDADVFDVTWSKIQLAGNNPILNTYFIFNGGDARSDGAEISAEFKPIEDLTFSASGAYVDAKLTSTSGNGFPGVNGDPLPFSSKYSASLSVEKQLRISNAINGFVGADAAYVGRRYEAFPVAAGIPRAIVPSYSYGNLRTGTEIDGYRVTLFVKNVTNERGILSSAQASPTDIWRTAFITPRTIGLSISAKF